MFMVYGKDRRHTALENLDSIEAEFAEAQEGREQGS
jgi:hypothetical protein